MTIGRNIIIGLCGLFLVGCGYALFAHLTTAQSYGLPSINSKSAVVLLVSTEASDVGLERSVLAQHQVLTESGVHSILVVPQQAFIAPLATSKGLPLILFNSLGMSIGSTVFCPGLTMALKRLVREYGDAILAVHCNSAREVFVAKSVLQQRPIPIVMTKHSLSPLRKNVRAAVDGLIGVSPRVVNEILADNKADGIVKPLVAIPPFFDAQRFLNFSTDESREAFFKRAFGVELKPCPLLVKIAHLYAGTPCKNHPVLLHAMHELIYKHNTPVQVALAGAGKGEAGLKKLTHDLGLDEYVYFLGATDQTPALFYHADIALLSGEKEAFGIVLAEGGLMKKPTIIADVAGAAGWLIEDDVTGFLFEAQSPTSLAAKIAFALKHPATAALCGERLFYRVTNDFSGQHGVSRLLDFYQELKANCGP